MPSAPGVAKREGLVRCSAVGRVPQCYPLCAGAITKLETSRKIHHSDGLRRLVPRSSIMVEGEKVGTLDLVGHSGNAAKVETVNGFDGPVSFVKVGDVVYALEDPSRYLFDSESNKKSAQALQVKRLTDK